MQGSLRQASFSYNDGFSLLGETAPGSIYGCTFGTLPFAQHFFLVRIYE